MSLYDWARRCTIHGYLNLAVAEDDDGFFIRIHSVGNCVVVLSLLAECIDFGAQAFRPVYFADFHQAVSTNTQDSEESCVTRSLEIAFGKI